MWTFNIFPKEGLAAQRLHNCGWISIRKSISQIQSLNMQMTNTVFSIQPSLSGSSQSVLNLLFDVCCRSKSAPCSCSPPLRGPRVIFANELLCCCHGNRPITTECEAGVAPLTPAYKASHPGLWSTMHNAVPQPSCFPSSSRCLLLRPFSHPSLSFAPSPPLSSSHSFIPSGLIKSTGGVPLHPLQPTSSQIRQGDSIKKRKMR